jgi:hypothetical protein
METKTNSLALGPTYTVYLYDKATGRVVHTHHQMTMKSGPRPNRDAVEQDALKGAARRHPNVGDLGIVHVENSRTDALFRVNVSTQALEQLDR